MARAPEERARTLRRDVRKITEAAGLGVGWAPRDLRHTFVSLISADGVPIEEIARLEPDTRLPRSEGAVRLCRTPQDAVVIQPGWSDHGLVEAGVTVSVVCCGGDVFDVAGGGVCLGSPCNRRKKTGVALRATSRVISGGQLSLWWWGAAW
jgi:hypothetical protein